ncbi:MAG: hypothetical protein VB074_08945 [Proteiniphilum sp.]|jgi:hypothetical protein|uniref:hypothetical protein n=1 Tax=Proteiniphilum sp. TaxID=1926877 RepID=UPI002B20079D|nr:hypothetical protein [Proteiniphilum sp.]MEA5128297.1 hypothetical protein [Proteiniphilum sp.]
MEEINSWQSFRTEATLKILVQQQQFFQWLKKFLYINEFLHNEFDSVYQQMYYVMLNQLLVEGIPYTESAVRHLRKSDNKYTQEWFETLLANLNKIKAMFPEKELDYIEYKRHNACHIFQNHYEQIQENGKIIHQRKKKDLVQIEKDFQSILKKYNGDAGFDKHVTITLYSILDDLYRELQRIHMEQVNENGLTN